MFSMIRGRCRSQSRTFVEMPHPVGSNQAEIACFPPPVHNSATILAAPMQHPTPYYTAYPHPVPSSVQPCSADPRGAVRQLRPANTRRGWSARSRAWGSSGCARPRRRWAYRGGKGRWEEARRGKCSGARGGACGCGTADASRVFGAGLYRTYVIRKGGKGMPQRGVRDFA